MKIAVCDDDKVLCNQLETYIKEYARKEKVSIQTEVFYSGESLLHYVEQGQFLDLLFLDIEMGRINGVDVGVRLREQFDDYHVQIVYISSRDCYDRQLFEVQPMHFLSKPLDWERVSQDIQLAGKLMGMGEATYQIKGKKIKLKDILYFESRGRKVFIHTNEETCECYGTMKEILGVVRDYRFVQVHRSYIVNYEKIKSIRCNEMMLEGRKRIPIGRSFKEELKEAALHFEMEQMNHSCV